FFKAVCCQSSNVPTELWASEAGQCVDATAETGIAASVPASGSHRSINVADFDNDGDQDIFIGRSGSAEQEAFLLNEESEPGVRVFADAADFMPGLQTGVVDRTGGAALDYDMDGFVDMFVASAERGAFLFHNLAVNTENHWVGFILRGTISNRDATGSLVTLVSGDMRQIRHTAAPQTWKVQENPFVHFGLGTATSIDSVIIRWPLGTVQVLKDVAIDQYHQVSEPNLTSVEPGESDSHPVTFSLSQNYPNPFNAGTSIEYTLPEAGHVTLKIYNLQGQTIATLIDAHQARNAYRIEWDGRDSKGQYVATGVYLYRLTAGGDVSIKKMLLMK
ncbi:ASPIC/UnbV domain-containing protein, partial [bacterium]|nr:ASPIC/UnbV domain-containing protein [bacterium]